MYLSHFGLNQAPFGITPNPLFFYAGNKRGDILDALIYAVGHGEGIIKVTGEVGSGKTMLCRMLESLLPSNIEVIYLVNPTLNRDEVIYAIAGELGLATAGRRADEVIRLLQNDLIAKHVAGKQVVLLVEEAQAMPLDTLEEIRLFSNLETAHHKLLQIVLFGQPELDESLNLPRMRQLKERITHSFKVPPLMPTVLPDFLMFRMRAAGYHGPDIFTKDALKLMASVSEGIIRRISILADKSLLAAFADNTHTIRAKHVKAAIEDSEFSSSARVGGRRNLLIGVSLALALSAAAGAWLIVNQNQKAAGAPSQPNVLSSSPSLANRASTLPPTASVSAPSVPPAKPATAVATATAVAVAGSASQSGGNAGSRSIQQLLKESKPWLNAQVSDHYSIQLALIEPDNAQVDRVLRKLQEEMGLEEIHIYPTRLGNSARFGVLYATFNTRAEAVEMKKKLISERGYQPQLRTISGIKAEIERSKSGDLWPN